MSRTDRVTYCEAYGPDALCEPYRTFSHSRSSCRKAKRALKRAAAKRNRRRAIPFTAMRGYSWGDDNVNLTIRGD